MLRLQEAAGAGAGHPLPVIREVEGKPTGLQRITGKDSHQEYSEVAAGTYRAKWGRASLAENPGGLCALLPLPVWSGGTKASTKVIALEMRHLLAHRLSVLGDSRDSPPFTSEHNY